MSFKVGDFVSTSGISVGEVIAIDEIQVAQQKFNAYIIADTQSELRCIIPKGKECEIRCLPSKKLVTGIFDDKKALIKKLDKELSPETSYHVLKEMIQSNDNHNYILAMLYLVNKDINGKMSTWEKKLFNNNYELFLKEMTAIVGESAESTKQMLQ